MGSQAGVVDINHAFHLYYKCCMWIEFHSISTWLRRFSPCTPVSSLLKIDSQSNPSGCGAVLRSHIWIVFRGRTPNRQHSSFGPTSLSCALCNSVYGLRERVISRPSILFCFDQHWTPLFRLLNIIKLYDLVTLHISVFMLRLNFIIGYCYPILISSIIK